MPFMARGAPHPVSSEKGRQCPPQHQAPAHHRRGQQVQPAQLHPQQGGQAGIKDWWYLQRRQWHGRQHRQLTYPQHQPGSRGQGAGGRGARRGVSGLDVSCTFAHGAFLPGLTQERHAVLFKMQTSIRQANSLLHGNRCTPAAGKAPRAAPLAPTSPPQRPGSPAHRRSAPAPLLPFPHRRSAALTASCRK